MTAPGSDSEDVSELMGSIYCHLLWGEGDRTENWLKDHAQEDVN